MHPDAEGGYTVLRDETTMGGLPADIVAPGGIHGMKLGPYEIQSPRVGRQGEICRTRCTYHGTSLRFCARTIHRHIRDNAGDGSGTLVARACTWAWLVIGRKQLVDAAGAPVGV